MFYRFEHEAPYDAELSRVPLYARMKLDLAGIKLTLTQWQGFAIEERRVLCHLPVDTDEELATFAQYVSYLCKSYYGAPAAPLPPLDPGLWSGDVPEPVHEASRHTGCPVAADEWIRWRAHERYALYKSAASRNEPEKFPAVLMELRRRKSKP